MRSFVARVFSQFNSINVDPSSIVIWILLVVFLKSLPVRILLTGECTTHTADSNIEVEFVELFGNDPEVSGIWVRARDICYDIHKLKNISTQVHTKVFNCSDHVTTALVTRRELLFNIAPQYKPMNIDIIRYTVHEFHVRPEEKTRLYHFTKGLSTDSVHYLEAQDTEERKIVYLNRLVRDVDLYPDC